MRLSVALLLLLLPLPLARPLLLRTRASIAAIEATSSGTAAVDDDAVVVSSSGHCRRSSPMIWPRRPLTPVRYKEKKVLRVCPTTTTTGLDKEKAAPRKRVSDGYARDNLLLYPILLSVGRNHIKIYEFRARMDTFK